MHVARDACPFAFHRVNSLKTLKFKPVAVAQPERHRQRQDTADRRDQTSLEPPGSQKNGNTTKGMLAPASFQMPSLFAACTRKR
jgi:hypothetical protein